MHGFRFQPPGCSIWVVGSDGVPDDGHFRWQQDSEGRPCRPELYVPLDLERSVAFRLAIEHEQRWKWILADFDERRRREEHERQRAEEAANRWDQIRSQWE